MGCVENGCDRLKARTSSLLLCLVRAVNKSSADFRITLC